MRVVVLGLRGVPNVEGGVETHVEHLFPRLAALGCEVEIFVRTPFSPPGQRQFGDIAIRRIWSPRTPGLEAFVHSVLGVLYAAISRPDIVHIHAIGPSIVTPIARLFGQRVVVTNHGPDYDRDKWGWFARRVLRLCESVGMRFSNSRIAISPVIADLIKARYGQDSEIIPNGVILPSLEQRCDELGRFGLTPNRYVLHVGRMVPEKRQLDLIQAYRMIQPSDWKLVMAGRLTGDAYSRSVVAAAAEAGVILTDFIKGQPLAQLYSHAGAFVLPSTHEGLPIALLEALSYGVPTFASDIPANLAVGLEAGSYFPKGDVAAISRCLRHCASLAVDAEARARQRAWVAERYDWSRIARQTLSLYQRTIPAAT